jgi:hypothetical protein
VVWLSPVSAVRLLGSQTKDSSAGPANRLSGDIRAARDSRPDAASRRLFLPCSARNPAGQSGAKWLDGQGKTACGGHGFPSARRFALYFRLLAGERGSANGDAS